MKKQILLIAMFVVAILAGTNAFAQDDDLLGAALTDCLTPTTLTCWDSVSSLHPSVGIEYTYTIESTDFAGSGTERVHWFVVDNADLGTNGLIATTGDMTHLAAVIDQADGSKYLLTAGPTYNIPVTDATPNTTDNVTLSWNYFNGQTNVVLLVAYVEAADGCTDNIEVYRIFPEFNFTLDIAGIDQDDYSYHDTTDVADECVSPIESASYTDVTGDNDNGDGTLTVDYGQNYVYFIVNAANFVGGWQPTFSFAYDGTGGQTVIKEAAWTYFGGENDAAATWNEIIVSTGASAAPVIAGGASATIAQLNSVGAAGECIVVRALLDYGTDYENVTETRVTVTVDGIMYDTSTSDYATTSLADYGPGATASDPCTQTTGDDIAYFDITPRPDVNEDEPTPFEQKTGEDL